jgi:hypothetical protein
MPIRCKFKPGAGRNGTQETVLVAVAPRLDSNSFSQVETSESQFVSLKIYIINLN